MRTQMIIIGLISVGVLALLALVFLPRLLKPEPSVENYWPTHGWQMSTPEEQGLDSSKLAAGLRTIRELNIPIDSLLLIRNGKVLLDASFYPYNGDFPHKLASVTKSVMTTLIAIAAEQGKLELDRPMLSYFPERTIANRDEWKEHITVRHLTEMRNGFSSGCLSGDESTLDAMRSEPDWVQAALDREMVSEPGDYFCYDSPGMHLLSAILQEATGMTALEFAQQNLFEPLGIQEVVWQTDPQGYSHGWGDLFLKPEDAAKIGYLWLNNGVWEGKQIVPAEWVAASVQLHSKRTGDDYGYGWWISEDSYFAMGRGGQTIKVIPGMNAIVVTTGYGLEYDEIVPYLEAAVIDPTNPLPENPAGVAELEQAIAAIQNGPGAYPTGEPPEIAKAVSNNTYVFPPNPADIESVRFDFTDPARATLSIKTASEGENLLWEIGMEGKFIQEDDGRALRGYWADPKTFTFDIFDIGVETYECHFEQDHLLINSPTEHFQLEGQVVAP